MAKLYPPIIEEIVPAFYGTGGLSVPYTINRAVGVNEIKGFALIVKSSVTNKEIYTAKNIFGSILATADQTGVVTFAIDTSVFLTGSWYKIQIAFIDMYDQVGYFSQAVLAKYIGKNQPNIFVDYSANSGENFIGTYQCEDITEKMNSYKFILYDDKGNLIEESGEQLHDSTADVGLTQKQPWILKRVLDNETNYFVKFEITTINNLVLTVSKTITAHKDPEGYTPYGIQLDASVNTEEGYVELTIKSNNFNDTRELIYGKFEIFKTSSKDNFQSKYRVAYFELQNQDLYEKRFKDFTVESGYSYIYVLQQRNDYGIYSEEIYSNKRQALEVYYENIYLFDGDRQLKIAFNPKVQSFKDTILEQKMDTIGSKYPFIFRNNTVKYKEVPISGLISYKLDPENLFMDDNDIWFKKEKTLKGENTNSLAWKEENWTHNLTDVNIAAERAFRLEVMEWLENGRPKLFKSPTEGNYILRLMNVSLTPVDTLGRMLYSFNATGYEIEDASVYSFADILQMDSSSKYIGYRTIPLWEEFFPPFYYVANNAVVPELNKYEIIGNKGLEWVIGFTLEDIKPGTKFDVIVERQLEKATLNLVVGATGVYHFPETLGYHIVSIKLYQDKWETGDYGFDIINNRGQVTYVYERQAKHNNFNDITKISLTKEISYPLISSWYNDLQLNQQLTSITGRPLQKLVKSGFEQEAFVEMGFFKVGLANGDKTIELLTRSVDYKYDNGKYTLLNGEPIELITEPIEEKDIEGNTVKIKNYGCKRNIGDPIYEYDQIYNYIGSVGEDEAYVFNKDNTKIELKAGQKYYCQLYNSETLYANNQLDINRLPSFFTNIKLINGEHLQENDEAQWIEGIAKKVENENNENTIISQVFKKATTSTGNLIVKNVVSGKPVYENPFYIKIYKDPDSINNKDWTQQTWDDPMLKIIFKSLESIHISQLNNNFLYNYLNNISSSYFDIDSRGILFMAELTDDVLKRDSRIQKLLDGNQQPTDFLKNLIYQVFQKNVEKFNLTVPLETLEPVYTRVDNQEGVFNPLYLPVFPKNVIQEKYYALKNITGEYYKKQENVHLYNLDFELIQVFYDEDLVKTGQNYTFDTGFLTLEDVNEDDGYQYTKRIIETETLTPIGLANDTQIQSDKEKTISAGNKQNYYLEKTERFVDKFEYGWNRNDWIGIENNADMNNTDKLKKEQANAWITTKHLISLKTLKEAIGGIYTDYINYLFDNAFVDYLPNDDNNADENLKEIIKNKNIDVFKQISYSDQIYGAYQYSKINDFNDIKTLSLDELFINLQAQALKKYNERTIPQPNEIVIVVNEDLSDMIKVDLTNRFSYHLDFDDESWDNVSAIYLGTNVRGFLTFDRKRYAYNAIGEDGVNVKLDFEE